MTSSLASFCLPSNPLVCFGDEMRLGLHSQLKRLKRRWCPRGHVLVQPQQMRFEWQWLFLAVGIETGQLFWHWQPRLRSDYVRQSVTLWQEQGMAALVWDNAPSHHAKVVTEVGLPLAFLPAFSPELNPAERLFCEVRRWIEGNLYDTLEAKVSSVEAFLNDLARDVERVKRLVGWEWIRQSLASMQEQTA